MKYIITFFLILIGTVLKSAPNSISNEYTIVGYGQGTTYRIKYYSNKPILKNSIDSILEVIDKSMSIYRDDSIISRFNQARTRKVKMDEHMKAVIAESFKTYKLTSGYFDITIMPLVDLWGFGVREVVKMPTDDELRRAHSLVGMKYLSNKRGILRKLKKGISIDLNGIAQGYTVDVLADYLEKEGIENFIVELGGEVVAKGNKPNGHFVVEIQRPYSTEENVSHKIILVNKAITSSGSYERQKEYNGKMISHHIDPKSGYPISSQILSVTVIANCAMAADAIDNFLMALKPHEAIDFIDSQKDMEAYIVYFENNKLKELVSKGFNSYLYNSQL